MESLYLQGSLHTLQSFLVAVDVKIRARTGAAQTVDADTAQRIAHHGRGEVRAVGLVVSLR